MTRKIAFAFPGQGSQSVGMLAEHFVTSKEFSDVFDISKEDILTLTCVILLFLIIAHYICLKNYKLN